MGSFRIPRRSLLPWVTLQKSERWRLSRVALLCQAAVWLWTDGGITRAETAGKPRERAKQRQIKEAAEGMRRERHSDELYCIGAILPMTLYAIMYHKSIIGIDDHSVHSLKIHLRKKLNPPKHFLYLVQMQKNLSSKWFIWLETMWTRIKFILQVETLSSFYLNGNTITTMFFDSSR